MDQPDNRNNAEKTGDLSSWYAMAGVGTEFVVALLVPGGIGYWLDGKFNTRPWLLIVGFALGFAYGLYALIRSAGRMFKN